MDSADSNLPQLLTAGGDALRKDAIPVLRRYMLSLSEGSCEKPKLAFRKVSHAQPEILSHLWSEAGEYAAGALMGRLRAAEVRRRTPALGPLLDTLCMRRHCTIRTPKEHLVTNLFVLGGAPSGGFRFEFSSMFGEDEAYLELAVTPLRYSLLNEDSQLSWATLLSKMGFPQVRLIDAMALVAYLSDLAEDGIQLTDRFGIDGSAGWTSTAAQVGK
jgi:hypothetical protein